MRSVSIHPCRKGAVQHGPLKKTLFKEKVPFGSFKSCEKLCILRKMIELLFGVNCWIVTLERIFLEIIQNLAFKSKFSISDSDFFLDQPADDLPKIISS